MTREHSKLASLAEAAESVPDGATVALGGLSMNSAPMAFVRELVRLRKRDLTVVAIVAGMSVDWLAAAGCAKRVITGLVSFEGFGLAPNFRRAAQIGEAAEGGLVMEEYSEHLLISRLQAQSQKLPFVPTRAGLGTDVLALHAESGTLRQEVDPVTGQPYVACTPLAVDVAVVQVHEADAFGNARVNPKLIWMDNEIVNAAERTVVCAERIVGTEAFVADPHRTTYPRFMVDAVCEAPFGAFPTSCFPDYGHYEPFFAEYAAAAGSPEDFEAFFAERVAAPESWTAFLDANGGARALMAVTRSRGGEAPAPGEAAAGEEAAGEAAAAGGIGSASGGNGGASGRARRASSGGRTMSGTPPVVPGYDCSVDELMVVAFSRAMRNDTKAFNGAVSFIPVCGYLLARRTHAPELVWAASSIALDADPAEIGSSTLSDELWGGASMLCNSPADFWSYAQGARYNTFAFRGAQMDAYGNVNNSVIGPYDAPKVRLPGGGGMADLGCLIPRIYLWSTTHNPRTFVERLDFRSGIGWGDGGEHRASLGLAGGPQLCITNLCVFDFEPESKRMRLASLHPGVTAADVVSRTGFEVLLPEGEVPLTAEPTAEELHILRSEVDPTGARRREF